MNNDFISGVGIGAILGFIVTMVAALSAFKLNIKDLLKK